LVVLDDDKHYFPPYDAVPIVRSKTLQRISCVGSALAALAGKITADDMRKMNYAVDGGKQDAKMVTSQFIESKLPPGSSVPIS